MSLVVIPISIRSGLILTNDKNEYLIVKDSRTKKWSFPKGGKEDCDKYLTDCAEREMFEETGFISDKDYIYNPQNHVCCVSQTKQYCSVYYFFIGKALKNDLYFKQKLEENIEEVKFVSAYDLMRMNINYVTKSAFLKNAFKDL